MLATLTLWVLMTFDTSTKQLHTQQFRSEESCKEGMRFAERMRGTFIQAQCIPDRAPDPRRHDDGRQTPRD